VVDAEVQIALSHWAPRFIQNGVDYNDFVMTTGRCASWAQWLPEWNRTADAAVEVALEAEADDHRRTAGYAWLRAAVNRHFGKFVWLLDRDLHAEATLRSVQELLCAHRCLDTGAERIEVPLDGGNVVANLRRPSGAARPSLVVLIPGLDSTKEEFFHLEDAFLQRGMATLSIDGPGQGEVGLELPIRHDYEVGVSAMLDAIAGRDDLDLERIGIFGVSLGGYYAPRVAAHEPRARAVIGLAGPFNFGDCWDALPPMTKLTFTVKAHAGSEAEARERSSELDLTGVCRNIAVPALYVSGRRDGLIPWQQTERIAKETPHGEFVIYEDGNHGCSNLSCQVRPALADWMRDRLAEVSAR
jgi:pimeloyl-ACP methyl ester carboxylesterase